MDSVHGRNAALLALLGVLSITAFAASPPIAAAASDARADGAKRLWYRIASVSYEWNHRAGFIRPGTGESGSTTTQIAWNARSADGHAPLIRRRSGGRLRFASANVEGNLTAVTHTYMNTWTPPQDPTPCTPEEIVRRESLAGVAPFGGGITLGLGFRWGTAEGSAKAQYVDMTGPVVCDECPFEHPTRRKPPEPGPGFSCTFPPDDSQEFDEARIGEAYQSEELEEQMLFGDEKQTRLRGGFGDEKIRFRTAIEGEAPTFFGPNGEERSESADKTVTFKLRICDDTGLRVC